MRGFILVAESVEGLEDGTVSATRVGLSEIEVPSFPCELSCSLIVRVEVDPGEERPDHALKMTCAYADGDAVVEQGTPFSVPSAPMVETMASTLDVFLPRSGEIVWTLWIDGAPTHSARLRVYLSGPKERWR